MILRFFSQKIKNLSYKWKQLFYFFRVCGQYDTVCSRHDEFDVVLILSGWYIGARDLLCMIFVFVNYKERKYKAVRHPTH